MSTVVYEDLGLGTLEADAERLLEDVVETAGRAVERQMKQNIIERGFVDTRATVNSVAVSAPGRLRRDIGPSTEYAIYGELGYIQVRVFGRRLAGGGAIHHPGLHFARDALYSVKPSFIAAVGAAVQRLGR